MHSPQMISSVNEPSQNIQTKVAVFEDNEREKSRIRDWSKRIMETLDGGDPCQIKRENVGQFRER